MKRTINKSMISIALVLVFFLCPGVLTVLRLMKWRMLFRLELTKGWKGI